MKILIIDTYYPRFLKSFWSSHRSLEQKSHKVQIKTLINQCFGTSDYYSYNLSKLGHTAVDIVANDAISQQIWANEHNIKVSCNSLYSKIQLLPLMYRVLGKPNWVQEIVTAQVKFYQPDVVYLQDLSILNPATMTEIKKHCKLVVGQIACPLPDKQHLKAFDLILTSFPHYVELFREMGIKSEYFRIGFESRLLKKIGSQKRTYDVSFVGSFSPHHTKGTALLEKIARDIPVQVWGNGLEFLSPNSPLRKHYHGEAWGIDMYKVLAQSKVVLNRHIGVSGKYANNMRLFESTGMGAMLLTDHKENLNDLFTIDKEVVSYQNSDDLIAKLKYYQKHPQLINSIAKAGQKKTLSRHSYRIRMSELEAILTRYL